MHDDEALLSGSQPLLCFMLRVMWLRHVCEEHCKTALALKKLPYSALQDLIRLLNLE